MDPTAQFAENLRRLRLAAGMTQDRLSDAAQMDSAEISRLERGGRDPQLLTIVRLARGLGVKPASEYLFMLIASPAGAYFHGGVKPVSVWLSKEYVRAAPGGTGEAKCAGNYAASLVAQAEAGEHGCDQVVWLDAAERRWIEEMGGMNLYFVHDDGTIVTPELTGTILEGVTRTSIMELAGTLGHKVEERRFSIDEWREGVTSGRITEVFACGTAAVVTPIGRLAWSGGEVDSSVDGEAGPVTKAIRQALVDLQYGRAEDTFGWMHRVL